MPTERRHTVNRFALHISTCPACVSETDGYGGLHAVDTCPEADRIFSEDWDAEVQQQVDRRFLAMTSGLESDDGTALR